MIKSITVKNDRDESIVLELMRPDKSGFVVKSIEGLGPVKATISTTKIATLDGNRYNNSRMDTRNIVLSLEFYRMFDSKGNYLSIEDIRKQSYRYFPQKRKVTLYVETDTNTLMTEGYVETNEPNIFSKNESTSISIICPDPMFYSVKQVETVFSGVQPAFTFPVYTNTSSVSYNSVTYPPRTELKFGDIYTLRMHNVYYDGDMTVGLTAYIHATAETSTITVYNTSTSERMTIDSDKIAQMTDHPIIAGDTIIINTHPGNKNITLLRDGEQINILNCLDRHSKWLTLQKGDNLFAFESDTGSTGLQFTVQHRNAYVGV